MSDKVQIRKKYDVAVLAAEPEEELDSIQSTAYWKEMEKNRVGNLLAGARLKAGLTQAQLAAELGIRKTWSAITSADVDPIRRPWPSD
jgi:hypothetical protein